MGLDHLAQEEEVVVQGTEEVVEAPVRMPIWEQERAEAAVLISILLMLKAIHMVLRPTLMHTMGSHKFSFAPCNVKSTRIVRTA